MDCSLRAWTLHVKLKFSMVVLKCCRFPCNDHKMTERYDPRIF